MVIARTLRITKQFQDDNFLMVRSREVKPHSANSLLAEGATVSVLLKRRRIFGDVSHRAAGALKKSVDSWRPPEFLAALTRQ
jgi:hypothetical protein